MKLNYNDHRPIYEQIKEKTKEYIVSGAIAEHNRLPSVRELAAQLAINPNTIQRAYKELETEGYIYSQKARGYFVAPMKKSIQMLKQQEKLQELEVLVNELHYLGAEKSKLIDIIDSLFDQ